MENPKYVFVPIATHAALVWDVLVRGDDIVDAGARFGPPVRPRESADRASRWHRLATVAVGVCDNGDVIQEIALHGRLSHGEERELREAVEREVEGALRDSGLSPAACVRRGW